MARDFVEVRAQVRLLSNMENARRGSWRPNHNFFEPDSREMTDGFIDLPDGFELSPGETVDVPIAFWWWPKLEGQIYPGREWRIQEGSTLVGIGRVIEVLDC